MELAYDGEFDNNWKFNEILISNNFEISKPGMKLTESYLWLKVNTILENQFSVNNYKITIDNRKRLRSDGENFIWSAPNPYRINENSSMVIEYEITDPNKNIEILIIDSGGNLVYNWINNTLNKSVGKNRVKNGWNAKNMNYQVVSSGIYLILLKVDSKIKSSWRVVVQ